MMNTFLFQLVALGLGLAEGLILDQGQLSAADAHALNQRLETEKAQRLLLQNDVEVLMRKVESLTKELNSLKKSVDAEEIAQQVFMVRLTKDSNPGPNQPIIYDKVLVNLANNYDIRHGTFTAKINGTYMFTVEACSQMGHFIHLSLQKNSEEMGTILGGSTGNGDCSSNTFVFPLLDGDDVWVQHKYLGDILSVHWNGNNFAGFLIHAM